VEKQAYYNYISDCINKNSSCNRVFNIGTWDEAHHKLFQRNLFSGLPNTYVLDGAILYFNGSYQRSMESVTGSRIFVDQWQYFVKPCNVFVCSSKRMNILLRYLNVIYGKHYEPESILQFGPSPPGVDAPEVFRIESGDDKKSAN
jgi:hypothetical protein